MFNDPFRLTCREKTSFHRETYPQQQDPQHNVCSARFVLCSRHLKTNIPINLPTVIKGLVFDLVRKVSAFCHCHGTQAMCEVSPHWKKKLRISESVVHVTEFLNFPDELF